MNVAGSEDGWRRVIVEKPFGTSLESAERLNKHLIHIFDEKEIYRIDHYLGKETVQNILVLRFSNGIFEPLWNRNYIDSIEISASETLGVENRGKYYDGRGFARHDPEPSDATDGIYGDGVAFGVRPGADP